MRLTNIFRLKLRSLFSRNKVERELDEELRYHLERQIEQGVAAGMSPKEARYGALQSIRNIEQRKAEGRGTRGLLLIEALLHDIRYGLRTLSKSPGLTFIALVTLGLGIGATTAIFSVVNGILLRPLPYKDPAQLTVLNETTPRIGMVSVSYPNFLDWRAQSHTFSEMAAAQGVTFNLSGIGRPENISGQAVSPNFLSLLGVHPFLGHDFSPAEEKAGTGILIGIIASLGLTRVMTSLLFSVSPVRSVHIHSSCNCAYIHRATRLLPPCASRPAR